MERHPVPQNIMEVQFKLFGSLTVKQFSYLAIGFLAGLAIYFTPLVDFIRYPAIFICAVLGLFFSIGQINGQPSTVWVGNFISALFSSQERIWKKTAITPEVFKDNLLENRKAESQVETIIGKKTSPIIIMNDAPLIAVKDEEITKYDTDVDTRLENIDQHLKFLYKDLPEKYNMNIVQPISKQGNEQQVENKKQVDNQNVKIAAPPIPEKMNLAGNIQSLKNQHAILGDLLADADMLENSKTNSVNSMETIIGKNINLIKGVIFNKSGTTVPGAQIYIRDGNDNLVRKALSDDKGSFSLSTPLQNDEYFIDIEAKGCKFQRFKVLLNGTESPIYKFTEGS